MQYSNGLLPNDQRHQLCLYGSYRITPEWSLGAIYRIASGLPKSCLGFCGPNQTDPGGYGSAYHWCNGMPAPQGGAGFTPWTHQLSLQVDYRPAFAQNKLDIALQVFNVFNEQKSLQDTYMYNGTTFGQPYPYYGMTTGTENPRYMQLGMIYDY